MESPSTRPTIVEWILSFPVVILDLCFDMSRRVSWRACTLPHFAQIWDDLNIWATTKTGHMLIGGQILQRDDGVVHS